MRNKQKESTVCRMLRLLLLCIGFLLGGQANAQDGSQELPVVDFANQILPVLEQNCLRCHDQETSAGELWFDGGRAAVVSGGQTGIPILGTGSADSVLFRRITSTKPGYRMPKEGPRLSDLQIGLFKRWLDQGAPWSVVNQPAAGKLESKSKTLTEWAGESLAGFNDRLKQPSFRNLFWLCVGFGVVAIVSIFRLWRRSGVEPAVGALAPARWKNWTIGGLLFLLLATWIHYDGKADRAKDQLEKTREELFKFTGSPDQDPLEPPYPLHPRRLGGVYYRGNDERNDALFNGGFYRTARLEVWLVDREGRQLEWGDEVTGELFVQFEIHRAVNTTGELFTERVMSQIAFTDSARNNAGQTAQMRCVTPEQVWQARLSIGEMENRDAGVVAGKLFVVQKSAKLKPHYGIVFDVRVTDGKIDGASQLWMGSLYDLKGRVLIPRGDKLLLDHWLDWRPIPEIEGEPSDDPELLGLPEHSGRD